MNKLIVLIIVGIMLITPMVSAQETEPELPEPELEIRWQLLTTRTIIWIGESLDVFVNGSANTSFQLELRFNSTNHQLYNNSSYYARGYTDWNGSAIMVIPDSATETQGEYRVQIVINMLVVSYRDIRVNFDPQRYDELQREEIWDYLNTYVQNYINSSMNYDRYEIQKIKDFNTAFIVIVIFLVLYVIWTLELQLNYHLYKQNKKGKKTKVKWLLSGGDNSEFFTLGGGIIYDKQPKLPKEINGVDLVSTGMVGKNTREMIVDINNRMGNYKRPKHKMMPSKKLTRKEKKKLKNEVELVVDDNAEVSIKTAIKEANHDMFYNEIDGDSDD